MAWLSSDELTAIGFASVGKGVLISEKASLYNCSKISIGNNVRIGDFCVLSAGVDGIFIGNYVHIAVYSSIIGAGKITLSDFSGLSSRVSIYSSNEDYSGTTMTNPTVPSLYTGMTHADVTLGKHVIVGAGSVILPGVTLYEGVAVGALSLVDEDCKAFGIYIGAPARRAGSRKKICLRWKSCCCGMIRHEKIFVSR